MLCFSFCLFVCLVLNVAFVSGLVILYYPLNSLHLEAATVNICFLVFLIQSQLKHAYTIKCAPLVSGKPSSRTLISRKFREPNKKVAGSNKNKEPKQDRLNQKCQDLFKRCFFTTYIVNETRIEFTPSRFYFLEIFWRVWRCQRSNQSPKIEGQTTQWPNKKENRDKQRYTKHTHKAKDRVHRCSGKVSNSCSTSVILKLWIRMLSKSHITFNS